MCASDHPMGRRNRFYLLRSNIFMYIFIILYVRVVLNVVGGKHFDVFDYSTPQLHPSQMLSHWRVMLDKFHQAHSAQTRACKRVSL